MNGPITSSYSIEFHGKHDIFQCRQRGNQVIGLEDKSQLFAAQFCHFVFAQFRDLLTINQDASRRRPIKACNQPEQRALSTA